MKKTIFLLALFVIFCVPLFSQGHVVENVENDSTTLNATTTTISVYFDLSERNWITTDSLGIFVYQDTTGSGVTSGDSIRSRVFINYYRDDDYDVIMATDTVTAASTVHGASTKSIIGQRVWTEARHMLREDYNFIGITGVPKLGTNDAAFVLSGTETIIWMWQINMRQYQYR